MTDNVLKIVMSTCYIVFINLSLMKVANVIDRSWPFVLVPLGITLMCLGTAVLYRELREQERL